MKSNLLTLIDVLWRNDELGYHSVDFDCKEPVGWESTSPIEDFSKEDLEHFYPNDNPNSGWWGRRVKTSHTHIPAPVTSLLTIRFMLERQADMPTMIVGSIYPGLAIGALIKDMTEETGRVFFDWNHPGAPWPE